jgi:hypothetical protein
MTTKNAPWFAISLILIGGTLLLHRLHVISFGWQGVGWALLCLFGAFKAVEGFSGHTRGKVFWGTLLFLVGLYGVLRHLDVVELRSYVTFPAILLALGFSLLATVLSNPKDWHLLVPALFFAALGTVLLLDEFGYFYRWDVVAAVKSYWPVVLILFGVAILLNRRKLE